MSNFMNKGRRKSNHKANKKRLAEVEEMVVELDRVAVELIKHSLEKDETLDRKDILPLAKTFTDMPLDSLCESILWAKLNDFEKRANAKIKENNDRDDNQLQPSQSTETGQED